MIARGVLFGGLLLVAGGRAQALSGAWIPYTAAKYKRQEIVTDLLVTVVSIIFLLLLLALQ
jgi:hypothetical protein